MPLFSRSAVFENTDRGKHMLRFFVSTPKGYCTPPPFNDENQRAKGIPCENPIAGVTHDGVHLSSAVASYHAPSPPPAAVPSRIQPISASSIGIHHSVYTVLTRCVRTVVAPKCGRRMGLEIHPRYQ